MNERIKRFEQSYRQSIRDMDFDNRVHLAERQLIDDIISTRWDLCPLNSERDIQRGERRLYKSLLKMAIWKAVNTNL